MNKEFATYNNPNSKSAVFFKGLYDSLVWMNSKGQGFCSYLPPVPNTPYHFNIETGESEIASMDVSSSRDFLIYTDVAGGIGIYYNYSHPVVNVQSTPKLSPDNLSYINLLKQNDTFLFGSIIPQKNIELKLPNKLYIPMIPSKTVNPNLSVSTIANPTNIPNNFLFTENEYYIVADPR